jgi:hypothetical protein
MELIRSKKNGSKNRFFQNYGGTLRQPQAYERQSDQLLIETLREDNNVIKKRLRDLESKLSNGPSRESQLLIAFNLLE